MKNSLNATTERTIIIDYHGRVFSIRLSVRRAGGLGFTTERTVNALGGDDLEASLISDNYDARGEFARAAEYGDPDAPRGTVGVRLVDASDSGSAEQRDDWDAWDYRGGTTVVYRRPRGRYVVATFWRWRDGERIDAVTFEPDGSVSIIDEFFYDIDDLIEAVAVVELPHSGEPDPCYGLQGRGVL